MSTGIHTAPQPDSTTGKPLPACHPGLPLLPDPADDALSAESVDDQIRWFFENAGATMDSLE